MSKPISATEINALRQQTGAGMMDCRKALVESNGDFEQAIDYLRKKGQKMASARSDREAKEGVVIAITNANQTQGVVLCLACETDFVSKNQDFVNFAKKLADHALVAQAKNLQELKSSQLEGVVIADLLNEQVAKIGEKIDITKYEFVTSNAVVSYIHGAYRIGVLVNLNQDISTSVETVGKDVAMQIAAMNPLAVDENAVSAELIERERKIIIEQMQADPKMEGKPEPMIEKIAAGKLNAFFKENTLAAQAFVKDPSKTVAQHIQSGGANLQVLSFVRIQLG